MKNLARWALILTILLAARSVTSERAEQVGPDLNVAAVWKALDVFLSGPTALAIFLFSRIDADAVLAHQTRHRIRERVRERPGIGLSELSADLDLGWGTTVYHVNRLEAAGLLASVDAGRKRALFLPEHGRVTRTAVTLLATDVQRRLLEHVQKRPGASQRELARVADVSLPLAHRYLRRLEDEGLVVSQKSWRTRAYMATPALAAYMDEHALRRMSSSAPLHDGVSADASPSGTRYV